VNDCWPRINPQVRKCHSATGTRPTARLLTTNFCIARDLKLTHDGRISIEECFKPVNFRKANNGRVTCFLRDPELP
jgi:hypothetical protein